MKLKISVAANNVQDMIICIIGSRAPPQVNVLVMPHGVSHSTEIVSKTL